jgi:hypothetical protein|tara:strand:+ start:14758 stop:15171 length:414 start_codon:yes stop_codon:yes gene_type:complete
LKILSHKNIDQIVELTTQLNPNLNISVLKERHYEMFNFKNHTCFGFYKKGKLIGVISGWITVRLYSGKQIEIDNVIIDKNYQSKGYGESFTKEIELWAKEHNCLSIELNTYLENCRSHQFYFKQGFKILGFHFQKPL